jgi:hypothetical protein
MDFLKALPTGGYRDILITQVIAQMQQDQKVERAHQANVNKSSKEGKDSTDNTAKELREQITFTAIIAQQHNKRDEQSDDDLSTITLISWLSTLFDSFILDSGSSIHICNNRERFILWDLIDLNYYITISDTRTYAEGTGSVKIIIKEVWTLQNM